MGLPCARSWLVSVFAWLAAAPACSRSPEVAGAARIWMLDNVAQVGAATFAISIDDEPAAGTPA